MNKSLARLRAKAYTAQASRCYYCGALMWVKDPSLLIEMLGIRPKGANHFKCTAEHLRARRDGGGNTSANIVAACYCCNSRRHRRKKAPSPERYKELVLLAVQRKTWPTARGVGANLKFGIESQLSEFSA